MKRKLTFRELFDCASKTLPYIVEGVILRFTDQLTNRLHTLKLSRTAFASKLGTSPAYVTKLLGGGTNFSLESMVKITEALNAELRIEIVPKASPQDWVSIMEKASLAPRSEIKAWSLLRHNQFVGPRFSLPTEAEEVDH